MEKTIRQNTKVAAVLRGLLFSYMITAVILLVLSFLMLKFDLPSQVISVGIIVAYIASAFVGGLFTGKRIEQKKFLWALVLGVVYFIILLLVSVIMNKGSSLPLGNLFTVFIICSLSGMAGGMIS